MTPNTAPTAIAAFFCGSQLAVGAVEEVVVEEVVADEEGAVDVLTETFV
jgi:hypothetical protein